MMEILIPILAVTVIGLICAVGLAVASSVMAVKEDTRFTEIRECLPGANCGACGYTGCDGYAKALLEPGTKTNLCVPGADAVAAQIARFSAWRLRTLWKRSPLCSARERARLQASRLIIGASPPARRQSCSTAAMAAASSAAWASGDCVKACPQGAISMQDGTPVSTTRRASAAASARRRVRRRSSRSCRISSARRCSARSYTTARTPKRSAPPAASAAISAKRPVPQGADHRR